MKEKTIKSTKWGRGIHSPFVYRLVTGILFSKYPYYAFGEIKQIATSVKERQTLESIFRLLDFFQPGQIYFLGEKDAKTEKICQMVLPGVDVVQFAPSTEDDKSQPLVPQANSFLIAHKIGPGISFDFKHGPVTFILKDLDDVLMRQVFETLKEQREVAVTIELNYFGVVIINGKLQKQNYVINH